MYTQTQTLTLPTSPAQQPTYTTFTTFARPQKPTPSQAAIRHDLNPQHLFTDGPESIKFNKALRNHLQNTYYFKQDQDKQYVDRIGNAPKVLGLKYNPQNKKDMTELQYILGYILQFPSQIVAQMHQSANKLGYYDTDAHAAEEKQYFHNKNPHFDVKYVMENKKICKCCGFYSQLQDLPLNQHIKNLNNIGAQILLYFQQVKNLIVFLASFFLIYGLFCSVRNIVYSLLYRSTMKGVVIDNRYMTFFFPTLFGKGSFEIFRTQQNLFLIIIQLILGTIVFLVAIRLNKRNQINNMLDYKQFDKEHKQIEDYTLFFPGLEKSTTPEQLTRQLTDVAYKQYEKIKHQNKANYDKLAAQPIKVQKINFIIPYYFEMKDFSDVQKYKQLTKQEQGLKKQIVQWLQSRQYNEQFKVPPSEREKKYMRLREIKGFKQKLATDLKQQRYNNFKAQSIKVQNKYLNAHVTFGHTFNKEFIERLNIDVSKLRSGSNSTYQWGSKAKIQTAYAPEDIKWNNYGQSGALKACKWLLLFSMNMFIIYLSYKIILLLTEKKMDLYQQNQSKIKDIQFDDTIAIQLKYRAIGAIISISAAVFTIIINLILEEISLKFTEMQRNVSHTLDELSIAVKTLVAKFVNSAMIPFIIARYLKKNNFVGADGLADDVFYFALISMITAPLLKIINITYIKNLLKRKILARPWRRLKQRMTQKQYNELYEYEKLSIGAWYGETVFIFVFTYFYASLQPIIILFGLINLSLSYLASKYCLFNWTRRPDPKNIIVNEIMDMCALFGIFMFLAGFGLGSNGPGGSDAFGGILKSLYSILFFFIFIIVAMISTIIIVEERKKAKYQVQKIFQQHKFAQIRQGRYEDDKLFFRTEYDRKNPATKQQAIKQFKQYYKKAKVQKISPQKQRQLQYGIQNGFGSGYNYGQEQIGLWRSSDEGVAFDVFEDDEQFQDIYQDDDEQDQQYIDEGNQQGFLNRAYNSFSGQNYNFNDSQPQRVSMNNPNLNYSQFSPYNNSINLSGNTYGNKVPMNQIQSPPYNNTYQSYQRQPIRLPNIAKIVNNNQAGGTGTGGYQAPLLYNRRW